MRKLLRVGSLTVLAALGAFEARALQVTLPLEKYEELRRRADPAPDPAPVPPAPFALEAADLEIAAGPSSARIVQNLTLTLYSPGWQTVPLGEAGSFIAADFGELEGRVDVTGDGWTLQVRGAGRHPVRLESVIPLTLDEASTRPTRRFGLRLPPAAVVRGRLRVPPEIEEVALAGPGLARRAADGSWTFVAAPAAPQLGVLLYGKAVVPEKARLPLRFEASSATAATLSRTQLLVHGWLEARVAQGLLRDLRVPVPQGFKVVSVQGPIAGWNVEGQTLVMTPLEPVETALAVEVDLTSEPRNAFPSPVLIPAGSARTAYFTKAALQGDGLLRLGDSGAVRGPEGDESARLPVSIRSAPGGLLALLDPARPPRWEAEWSEGTEVLAAQVDRLLIDVAVGESGRAAYQLWAEVRNHGAQQLTLALPPGFELVEGRRDGQPVTAGSASGGLAVPLRTEERPQVVHLAGVLPLPLPDASGAFQIPLPSLSAPAARVEVRVLLPGGRTYELEDKTRAGGIGFPPRPSAVSIVAPASQAIVQQVLASRIAAPPAQGASFFSQPPGFAQIAAAWSALSATPAPLAIRVRTAREKEDWF